MDLPIRVDDNLLSLQEQFRFELIELGDELGDV